MTTFADELVNHIQAVAIAHAAWRGHDTDLAELLAKSLKTPDRLNEIRRLLHSTPLRASLAPRDILIWTGKDGLLRLVDAQPVGHRAAIARTAHHPGGQACRFCLMREAVSYDPELLPERDTKGDVVVASFVHPACAVPWARLRAQVAQKEVSP